MKKPIVVSLLSVALSLSACSIPVRSTPVPAAPATLPAGTPTSASTAAALLSTGTPVVASEWNGIPIMPGALAGEGDEESYVFTIRAMPQQVRDYYEIELGRLGWQLLDPGDDSTLSFTNDAGATLTMSILANGDEALVLLVK